MSFTKMLRPLTVGILAAGIASFAPTAAFADNWTCYTYMPAPTHPVTEGIFALGAQVSEITDGRVEAECHVGGSLPIDANSITPAIQDGVIDLALNGFISGVIPVAGLMNLPGLLNNREQMATAYKIVGPLIEAEFDKRDIVPLAYYFWPEQVFWAKGDLNSLEDLKGKSVRVQNAEQAAFATAVGAVPVTLAAAEVPPALQRGTLDVVITAAAGGGRLWREQFDHALLTATNLSIDWIQVSKTRFNKLSADEQTALRAAAQATADSIGGGMKNDTSILLKEFAEIDKMVITQSSDADREIMANAMEPIWDKWAAERGQEVVDVLAKVRAAVGK